MDSPWYGVIFLIVGLGLGWTGVAALRDRLVTIKDDQFFVVAVHSGDEAAVYGWCMIVIALAIALIGVVVVVRETRRRRIAD